MSNLEPKTKKIKLSLEPSIDNKVVDITNAGQEIFKTETTLPEKLMQSVDRIWFERGEWKDISEKSLLESIEKKQQQEEQDIVEIDQDDESNGQQQESINATLPPPTGYDIAKLRESVINKLFHAKSEIDVALDVINILAAGNRSSATVKDLVLPSGSLTATYVTKPKPTMKAQLESVQLNLGLKRKKQKQASDFLKQSAASLKNLVEKDQVFWDEALDLRRNNWLMQANTQPGGTNTGSSFFIQYGFAEVGSDFNEASVGELKRAGDNSKKLQMSLPHGTSRKIAVRISQSHTGKLGLGQKAFSEGILGITDQEGTGGENKDIYKTSTIQTLHSDIQNQLAEAHSTVFDAELFSDILAEAQALNSNVRFPDDEIVINIDGQIDLSILRINSSNNKPPPPPPASQQNISRTIDLSFRLLLVQHQKFNMWKNRAKILSSNHKIHQLLLHQNEPTMTTPTPTTAVNTQNNNVINNNNIPNTTNATAMPSTSAPGGASNTMIGTNNPVPMVTNVAPVSNSAATISTALRVRTKSASASTSSQLTRDLPKETPILLPIMSLTRFWVQFDRIRHVVHAITSPFTGQGGLSISVHFKFSDLLLLSKLSSSKITYDVYPGYSETALSLGISVLKGPSLHFGLNQSGSISVYLPQTTVTLQNVSEFEAFLSREIKVICLRTVCDVANEIIKRNKNYKKATGSDKQRLLWKVDQVDEAIHGWIYWQQQAWRNINISLKSINNNYELLFRLLCPIADDDKLQEQIYSLSLSSRLDSAPHRLALNFKERACVIIQKIVNDAMLISSSSS